MPDDQVNADTLAAWLGVSKRSIAEFAARGTVKRTARGRYALRESVQLHTAHLREVAAARGGEAAILDLTQERARLAREQADGHSLKNQIARGEYVDADEVARAWADVLRGVRAAMLAVPSRVRGRNPALTAADVQTIDREIRDALEALADEHTDDDGAGDESPAAAATPPP
ncbi:hypothetical protein [Aurantimonas coralicida]|uniref:hypothetical protein n=1 Tax=Aurantimonas coralicida TaxID=182270 RepID=UPI001E41A59A|nr:hypothetical protein [Aurantimonas coralicida]MCD1642468.1 hypothetical protein [Aurantimonas coralicida]